MRGSSLSLGISCGAPGSLCWDTMCTSLAELQSVPVQVCPLPGGDPGFPSTGALSSSGTLAPTEVFLSLLKWIQGPTDLYQGSANYSRAPTFVRGILLESSTLVRLHTAHGCLPSTAAKESSRCRGRVACKAGSIYCLILDGKSLPAPAMGLGGLTRTDWVRG